MPEFSAEAEARMRDFVGQVLDRAVLPYELASLGIFSEDEVRLIQREAERLLYEPKLPHGGPAERKIAEKLLKLSRREGWANRHLARMAAEKWEEIDGWYYRRKPLLSARNAQECEWYKALIQSARISQNWD